MNGCQFGFGSSALRGEKWESGGGLCASLPVEKSSRDGETARHSRREGSGREEPHVGSGIGLWRSWRARREGFQWHTPGKCGWGGDLNESCFCLSCTEH